MANAGKTDETEVEKKTENYTDTMQQAMGTGTSEHSLSFVLWNLKVISLAERAKYGVFHSDCVWLMTHFRYIIIY